MDGPTLVQHKTANVAIQCQRWANVVMLSGPLWLEVVGSIPSHAFLASFFPSVDLYPQSQSQVKYCHFGISPVNYSEIRDCTRSYLIIMASVDVAYKIKQTRTCSKIFDNVIQLKLFTGSPLGQASKPCPSPNLDFGLNTSTVSAETALFPVVIVLGKKKNISAYTYSCQ